MIPQVEELLSESFFHPETGPGAAGQVVMFNCRSTERHACGSPKERAGRREERAKPNDCQQIILSRKNGASRKHHKIKQLQQIITAIRHQGKTKTVNISRFTFITFTRHQPAILKLKNPFHAGRQIRSMRYQNKRHSFLAVQFDQQAGQFFRGGAVEGAGRFVGQQKFRLVD